MSTSPPQPSFTPPGSNGNICSKAADSFWRFLPGQIKWLIAPNYRRPIFYIYSFLLVLYVIQSIMAPTYHNSIQSGIQMLSTPSGAKILVMPSPEGDNFFLWNEPLPLAVEDVLFLMKDDDSRSPNETKKHNSLFNFSSYEEVAPWQSFFQQWEVQKWIFTIILLINVAQYLSVIVPRITDAAREQIPIPTSTHTIPTQPTPTHVSFSTSFPFVSFD